MSLVRIDCRRIKGWSSFHDYFSELFEFPDFYGRNMDAWIDCMTYLRDPDVADCGFQLARDDVCFLHLEHAADLKKRCPEIFEAIVECSAFCNYRQIVEGDPAPLALSFCV